MRPTDIELYDSQSSETALIGGIIETQHKDALEEIINEVNILQSRKKHSNKFGTSIWPREKCSLNLERKTHQTTEATE